MDVRKLALFSILTIFIVVPAGNAQDKSDEANVTTNFAKAVKNAAFSADVVGETVQILADGNTLTRQTTGRLFRDNHGRFRQEQTANPSGIFGGYIKLKPVILILDPVANVQWILNPETKTAQRSLLESPTAPEDGGAQMASEAEKSDFIIKTDPLGGRKIEGIEAVGTRTITTIPAGKVGNARAIEVVYERWYSNELQVIIFSKNIDPRFGEQIYRLTNISRSEPGLSLFRLPADYKIVVKTLRPAPSRKPPPPRNPVQPTPGRAAPLIPLPNT